MRPFCISEPAGFYERIHNASTRLCAITGPRGADPAVRDHSEQELRRKLSAPVMSKMGRKRLMPSPKIMTG